MRNKNFLLSVALAGLFGLSGCGGGGGDSGNAPGGNDPGGNVPSDPVDTQPDAFGFGKLENLFLGVPVVSESVKISGIDAPAAVAASGGKYSINSGPFTGEAGTIAKGDEVRLMTLASGDAEQSVTAVLDIGGVKGSFVATTGPALNVADVDPEPFVLADIPTASKGEMVTSEPITITHINAPAPISVTGGEYSIEAADFTAEVGRILPGQRVRVRGLAPKDDGQVHAVTLRIGNLVESFVLATPPAEGAPDTVPGFFVFEPVLDAEPDSDVLSKAATISGLSAAATVHIEGGEYSLDGGATFTSADGVISDGGTVLVRTHSSAASGGVTGATLVIGGVPSVFIVATREIPFGSDITPADFTFGAADAVVGTLVSSPVVLPLEFDAPAPISVEGGEYRINLGEFTTSEQLVLPGQFVQVRGTAGPTEGDTRNVALSIGETTGTFTIHSVVADSGNLPPDLSAAGVFEFGGRIYLDAVDVTDSDEDPVTLTWEQLDTGTAPEMLVLEAEADAGMMSAAYSVSGTYRFRLTASDGVDTVSKDFEITVTVAENLPPVAAVESGNAVGVNADGIPMVLLGDGVVVLDAQASSDDGDFGTLTYTWLEDSGNQAKIDTTTLDEFFPGVVGFVLLEPVPGIYNFGVKVEDEHGETDTAFTTIEIFEPEPLVPHIEVLTTAPDVGIPVDLSAAGSTGDIALYEWYIISAPGESTIPIVTSLGFDETANFTPDVSGSYEVELVINGVYGDVEFTTVIVTVP